MVAIRCPYCCLSIVLMAIDKYIMGGHAFLIE